MNLKNKPRHILPVAALLLAACTPADIDYCRQFGVAGTAEYGNCLEYYQQQEAAFGADYRVCASEADATYPPTLYDRGGFSPVVGGGFGRYPYYSGGFVSVEPDHHHNAEVDRLRARIIAPCMEARGWNSPRSWQAGRHAVKPAPRGRAGNVAAPAAPAEKLPWLP